MATSAAPPPIVIAGQAILSALDDFDSLLTNTSLPESLMSDYSESSATMRPQVIEIMTTYAPGSAIDSPFTESASRMREAALRQRGIVFDFGDD